MYTIVLYAETEDESIAEELSQHLNILEQSKTKVWTTINLPLGETLLDKVEGCELFVLLISINTINNLAENEAYQKAVELNKDICLVLGKSCIWETTFSDQKYTVLPSNKEFINDLENRDAIYTSIVKTIQQKIKAHTSIIPTTNIPKTFNNKLKNIPSAANYFTGRVDKLKEFKDNYKQNNFFLIEGGGGIGKTQFCAKCIDENSIDREKILWFNCEEMPYFDLLVEQAGFPQILKGESKRDIEKVISFIEKMNEHGLVLFLENYEDASKQIFELFLEKAQNTLNKAKVIVISRDRLGLKLQPKKLKLSKFNEQEALAYCHKVSQHVGLENRLEEEEILNLTNQLKGHPLAIYLASLLLERGAELEDILAEILESESSEIVSKRFMNALFERTDTSDAEKDFILKFAAFRAAVTVEEVKAIFSKENVIAAKKLCNKNILQLENKQYSLHPLVREYCYQKLDNKAIVHQQIAEHYLPKREAILDIELENKIYYHLAQAKDTKSIEQTVVDFGRKYIEQGHFELLQLMMSSLTELPDITTIFYGDIAEIRGAYDNAIAYYQQASKSSNQAIQAEGIIKQGEMFYRKGDAKGANPYFEQALVLCQNNNLKKEEARALNDLGLVQEFLGDYEDALKLHKKSLKIRRALDYRWGIATSLNNIGSIYDSRGDYTKALKLYEESLEIEKTLGNQSGIATSLNNIGWVYDSRGDYTKALKLYEESLEIKQTLGNQSGIATSLNNIGSIYDSRGDYTKALKLYEESLEIEKTLGDQSGIATSLNQIGRIYNSRGDYTKALKLYEESLEIKQTLGNQSGIASSLSQIGNIYNSRGDYTKALKLYEESLEIRKTLGDQSGIATSLNNIGWVYDSRGDYTKALKLYEESLEINKILGNQSGIASSLSQIGNIYNSRGDYTKALKLYEESLEIRKTLGEQSGVATSLNNIGWIYKNKKNYVLAIDYYLRSILIKKRIGRLYKDTHSNILDIKREIKLPKTKKHLEEAIAKLSEEEQKIITPVFKNELLGMPQQTAEKVGRNEPCPCGSGKKYKKCHGKK